jgi:hypothetical protein
VHAGGACGFKNVNLPPFSAMTSCGNQPLFKDGKGCGSCYQVHYLVRVTISRISRSSFVLLAVLVKMETETDRQKTR